MDPVTRVKAYLQDPAVDRLIDGWIHSDQCHLDVLTHQSDEGARAVPRAPALGARALVRLAWAGAAVRLPGSELEPIFNEASTRAERLQPKAMANLLWAMAAVRRRQDAAMLSLLPHVVDRCRDLAPQGLANSLWALAALRPRAASGDGFAPPGWLEEDAVPTAQQSVHLCSLADSRRRVRAAGHGCARGGHTGRESASREDFSFGDWLGNGSFCQVVQCTDTRTSKKYAAKQVAKRGTGVDQAIVMEAHCLRKLDSFF
eukprot:s645_g3.t1